jgi:hypothetical protein
MIKAYLNSEIGIEICVINNAEEIEMYTIRKSRDLFYDNYRGLGLIGCNFYLKILQHG